MLDCLTGSGTTAVAAYNQKRHFVGCEIAIDYYQKSIDRMKQLGIEVSQDLFNGSV